jgi:hypothetical protein
VLVALAGCGGGHEAPCPRGRGGRLGGTVGVTAGVAWPIGMKTLFVSVDASWGRWPSVGHLMILGHMVSMGHGSGRGQGAVRSAEHQDKVSSL